MLRDHPDENLPLQIAIVQENWNVASILLEETIKCGVDLSQEEYPLIRLAIDVRADYSFLTELLTKVPGSCRMKNKKGMLPLMYAIHENQIADPEILRQLIDDYPEALQTPDEETGDLPLQGPT